MSKIQIHTKKWNTDRAIHDNDENEASASIQCRVFIDGQEVPQVLSASPKYKSDQFMYVTLVVMGEVEIVNHTQESWLDLP
ncbi:MAG: hypothetical protein OEV86_13990 [Candidatus Krumholzibacteria bacterium]|nr:hypothetical protein [Candidatus Krumholzibacteria bacterium]